MGRILWPPIIRRGVFHLVGYPLTLVRRLKPFHIIVGVILGVICFTALGRQLTAGKFKKRLPALDPSDLLDHKDGKLTVPSNLEPLSPIRIAKANRFDNRYEFQHSIGGGYEGDVAVYRDMFTDTVVVVKTYFNNGHHPMTKPWSDLFCNKMDKWPTEIPATLLLAGPEREHSTLTHHGHTFQRGLVTVSDFFVSVTPMSALFPSWTRSLWHLVTPFIPAGTLENLALSIRHNNSTTATDPHALDSLHRPTFARLLSSLSALHARGYCHNDIKPENIFIHQPPAPERNSSWLLADLGQALPRTHPFLQTRYWAEHSQWTSDCRLNDVRRVMKSYVAFLRDASTDAGGGDYNRARVAFDRAFYEEREAWSQLYWGFMREPVGAEEMVMRLGGHQEPWRVGEKDEVEDVVEQRWKQSWWWQRPWGATQRARVLEWAVDRELKCTAVHGWLYWRDWRTWWASGDWWQRFPFERSLRDLVKGG